jgi:hypothetical protein
MCKNLFYKKKNDNIKNIMIIKKIIILNICLYLNICLNTNKTIQINSLTEIENILIKEKIDIQCPIFFHSNLVLQFVKKNKIHKDHDNKKFDHEKKKKINFFLRKEEDKVIVNNLIKKYINFFLLHKGKIEDINFFTLKNQDKINLPVKISNNSKYKSRYGDNTPALVGNILYCNFFREDLMIFLLLFYKKLVCKKIVIIIYGDNIFYNYNSSYEILIISLNPNHKIEKIQTVANK